MTVLEDSLKAVLVANAPLMVILDGGVVTFDATGRNGIGVTSTPTLFQNGFLKTVCEIKEIDYGHRGGIRDRGAKTYSGGTEVQFWFLQDGDDGYDELVAARQIVYDLMTDNAFSGIGTMKFNGFINGLKDSDLDNAAVLRLSYMVISVN